MKCGLLVKYDQFITKIIELMNSFSEEASHKQADAIKLMDECFLIDKDLHDFFKTGFKRVRV